jgi:hypothetical protein
VAQQRDHAAAAVSRTSRKMLYAAPTNVPSMAVFASPRSRVRLKFAVVFLHPKMRSIMRRKLMLTP